MRLNLPIFRRLVEALRKRDWFGIAFELFVVILGVVLGIEASRWAADREERAYRHQMIAALDETLADFEGAGPRIHNRVTTSLDDFARRTAAGERPPPPILRFPTLERPPTRAWEAMIATGLARSIDPRLVYRLAKHFSRADSFGDRYQRYNGFSEQQVLPYLSEPARFYGPDGKLSPLFASHVDRLREMLELNDTMTKDVTVLRRELKAEE